NHINKPKESFYDDDNRLQRKLIIHGSLLAYLNEKLVIKPEAMFSTQAGTSETVFGANVIFEVKDIKLYCGIWHRLLRDIIPVAGLEYNNFTFLFSYDVNISDLHPASNYQGGLEISLIKKFCYSNQRSTKRHPCKFLDF
ncbi:MAG: type IX secretion system membrane protein PorP/SprF, partial [Bacteroidales bacterium]|nr:type IX secretion system membrane protein PorP/SprF [Bacteroidales bacterium]